MGIVNINSRRFIVQKGPRDNEDFLAPKGTGIGTRASILRAMHIDYQDGDEVEISVKIVSRVYSERRELNGESKKPDLISEIVDGLGKED